MMMTELFPALVKTTGLRVFDWRTVLFGAGLFVFGEETSACGTDVMRSDARRNAGRSGFGDENQRVVFERQRFAFRLLADGAGGHGISLLGAGGGIDGLLPIVSGRGDWFGRRQHDSALSAKHKSRETVPYARGVRLALDVAGGVGRKLPLPHYPNGISAGKSISVRTVFGASGRNGDDGIIVRRQRGERKQRGPAAGADQARAAGCFSRRRFKDLRCGVPNKTQAEPKSPTCVLYFICV